MALPQNATGTNFINRTYEFFKSDLEARTNGSLKVELIYGGALGSAVDRMNMMRHGAIKMSDASDGNYATIYPDIQVLNIPYLFSGTDHAVQQLRRHRRSVGMAQPGLHFRAEAGRLQLVQKTA